MKKDEIADVLEDMGQELRAYLTRFVLRPAVAEELVQETAVRALQSVERAPDQRKELRPWLFRIATNLAIDARRKQSFRRENLMESLREIALSDQGFYGRAQSLIGQPEMRAVAREHLAFCLRCTVHNLSEPQAASLLLKSFHDLTHAEVAQVLSLDAHQVKNRLQEARAALRAQYGQTCALVTQDGTCHQCVELDAYYEAGAPRPLAGETSHINARVRIDRVFDPAHPTVWQSMLVELIESLEREQASGPNSP